MKTLSLYYVILSVYISLWTCQLVAGHLTHSLIILTDSYINLYRILDISLGILHLRTQRELVRQRTHLGDGALERGARQNQTLAGRLFDCACTYQFKRLPLLGSFVNGLFLAAFLMSAAIEGIQTCFHTGHSQGNGDAQSVLKRDPLTYPLMLAGFALVGLCMQHCSLKAHEMREEELLSESLLDLSQRTSQKLDKSVPIKQLNATELMGASQEFRPSASGANNRRSSSTSGNRRSYDLNGLRHGNSNSRLDLAGITANGSLQELQISRAGNEIPNDLETHISLKSLKFASNLDSIVTPTRTPIESISEHFKQRSKPTLDIWFVVRYLTSPVALVACACIVYFVGDDLATEILDAVLSVAVVVLLFTASYPQMKKTGRVLLQTAPVGVDLVRLERELLSCSEYVLEVRNLHVWSLTPRTNRVATCQLILDTARVSAGEQVRQIITQARDRFLDQNIKCTTIEPIFFNDEDNSNNSENGDAGANKPKAACRGHEHD